MTTPTHTLMKPDTVLVAHDRQWKVTNAKKSFVFPDDRTLTTFDPKIPLTKIHVPVGLEVKVIKKQESTYILEDVVTKQQMQIFFKGIKEAFDIKEESTSLNSNLLKCEFSVDMSSFDNGARTYEDCMVDVEVTFDITGANANQDDSNFDLENYLTITKCLINSEYRSYVDGVCMSDCSRWESKIKDSLSVHDVLEYISDSDYDLVKHLLNLDEDDSAPEPVQISKTTDLSAAIKGLSEQLGDGAIVQEHSFQDVMDSDEEDVDNSIKSTEITKSSFTVNRNDFMENWMINFDVWGDPEDISPILQTSEVPFVDTSIGDGSHFVYDEDTEEPLEKQEIVDALLELGFTDKEGVMEDRKEGQALMKKLGF